MPLKDFNFEVDGYEYKTDIWFKCPICEKDLESQHWFNAVIYGERGILCTGCNVVFFIEVKGYVKTAREYKKGLNCKECQHSEMICKFFDGTEKHGCRKGGKKDAELCRYYKERRFE